MMDTLTALRCSCEHRLPVTHHLQERGVAVCDVCAIWDRARRGDLTRAAAEREAHQALVEWQSGRHQPPAALIVVAAPVRERAVARHEKIKVGPDEKLCVGCGTAKPKSAFDRANTGDGLAHRCRTCAPRLALVEKHLPPPAASETAPDPDELVSLSEAARQVGVDQSTVGRWRDAGLLVAHGTGRQRASLVSLAEVQAVAAARYGPREDLADPGDLTGLPEICEQLGLSDSTVGEWLRSEAVTNYAKPGAPYLVSAAELRAHAVTRKQPKPSRGVQAMSKARPKSVPPRIRVEAERLAVDERVSVVADRKKGLVAILVDGDELVVPLASLDGLVEALVYAVQFLGEQL